jgi:hypothetical protein
MNSNANKLSFNELAKKIKSSTRDNQDSVNDEHFFQLDQLLDKLLNDSHGGNIKDHLEGLIDSVNDGFSKNGFMNFYPSNLKGGCHTFCLGVATKKFDYKRDKDRNRTGFKGLIKELIAYWFNCNVNQKTIILTTDWDNEAFEDGWKKIIDSYENNTRHEVEIYLMMEMTREAIQVF